MANKDFIVVEDLAQRMEVQDTDLIIVEDQEDTKQATVLDLKKCFTGDYKNPDEHLFYSSKKTNEMINGIKRDLSTFASNRDLKSVQDRVEDIIVSNGEGKDSELIYARDGMKSLNLRLERDIFSADDKYMKKPIKRIKGAKLSTGTYGYVNIYLDSNLPNNQYIVAKSKNLLDLAPTTDHNFLKWTDTGFIYSQVDSNRRSVPMKLNSTLPKGKYFFFTNIEFDNIFGDTDDILLVLTNSKDTTTNMIFTYNQEGKFEFEATKTFDKITIQFNEDKFVNNAAVEYKNIMLMTSDEYSDTYVPYEYTTINKDIRNFYNANYDFYSTDNSTEFEIEFYDQSIVTDTMCKDIEELKSVLIEKRDKCGLIENYGEYLFFDDSICETPSSCRLSLDEDKFMRNGIPSLKVIFQENVNINPLFTLQMKEFIENIESVSLSFYIDRTISYFFTSSTPITIYLCSDNYSEPEMVNYFKASINADELVQGWNIVKRHITEFTKVGRPNEHSIKYVKVEVIKNSGLDNKEMYFNSVVFNQRMKSTVLLAFDGIYEEGVEYTYPYLTTRGIPATIFSNNRTTFSRSILEYIVDLRARYGWDLGQYGCNPNKELLTHDDNAREQYLALRNAKEWLKDNLVYNPISYSAPYGNLRPITVPILKDLGYKITKTESAGYCNFFDPKYDFAIPMVKMSNETTEEDIINKIQYAIDHDCCICIYTSNVTNYGSELDAKKTLLESVVNYILENKDKITPMTFSDFYNKCNE